MKTSPLDSELVGRGSLMKIVDFILWYRIDYTACVIDILCDVITVYRN